MSTELTPKQARVLEFIAHCVQEQGYPPSFQELAQGLDLTEERNAFVMEMRGGSMIDDGICEGSLFILQQQVAPGNGDTAVAVVHGEAHG